MSSSATELIFLKHVSEKGQPQINQINVATPIHKLSPIES
jgi:hypothetical protein